MANVNIVSTDSLTYICLHEAGHATVAHKLGATVREMEVVVGAALPGRMRADVSDQNRKPIACGGYAVECLLFENRRLLMPDGTLLTDEGAFQATALRNAAHDKEKFFGGDYSSDGAWPPEMNREFKAFADLWVKDMLRLRIAEVVELASALESRRTLDEAQIKEILEAV